MRKSKPKVDEMHKAQLSAMEPGSMEHDTFERFAEASAKHGALADKLTDNKWHGADGRVPEKHRAVYNKLCKEIDRAREIMFRAFDTYTRTTKHTIHVPEDEMRSVIYDVLMANKDALPDNEEMTGPERGHHMKSLATEIIGEFRAAHVQVREDDMEAVYCDACEEQLS